MQSGTATEQERKRFREIQAERTELILSKPAEELFDVRTVTALPPPRARLHESLQCEECGEAVMETRIRRFRGRNLCIPCFDGVTQGRS